MASLELTLSVDVSKLEEAMKLVKSHPDQAKVDEFWKSVDPEDLFWIDSKDGENLSKVLHFVPSKTLADFVQSLVKTA